MTTDEAIETAKSLDARTTTEEAAAIALDILSGLAPIRAERDRLHKVMRAARDTHEDRERCNDLTDEYVRIANAATRVMRLHVFNETEAFEIKDWIDDDLDALMADLADIARGDY